MSYRMVPEIMMGRTNMINIPVYHDITHSGIEDVIQPSARQFGAGEEGSPRRRWTRRSRPMAKTLTFSIAIDTGPLGA